MAQGWLMRASTQHYQIPAPPLWQGCNFEGIERAPTEADAPSRHENS
jgi:hypothetical protein